MRKAIAKNESIELEHGGEEKERVVPLVVEAAEVTVSRGLGAEHGKGVAGRCPRVCLGLSHEVEYRHLGMCLGDAGE
jgi:hypothetical protein